MRKSTAIDQLGPRLASPRDGSRQPGQSNKSAQALGESSLVNVINCLPDYIKIKSESSSSPRIIKSRTNNRIADVRLTGHMTGSKLEDKSLRNWIGLLNHSPDGAGLVFLKHSRDWPTILKSAVDSVSADTPMISVAITEMECPTVIGLLSSRDHFVDLPFS